MICKICGSQVDICFCPERVEISTSGSTQESEESTTIQELEQRIQRLEDRHDALVRLEYMSYLIAPPFPS